MSFFKGKRIWIAGATGMVGASIVRNLSQKPCTLLIPTRSELDLTRQSETEAWARDAKPDIVFVAAAKVGGIAANSTYVADFGYINQVIQSNIIHSAFLAGAKKLVFLGSACMYPRSTSQPMHEDQILTGPLEPTNEPYAVAKIAGMNLCQGYRKQYGVDYITLVPTNSYGPHDNYDPETSHVPAALMVKFHEAKKTGKSTVDIWGTGTPTRDFLHVDDMAGAIVIAAEHYSSATPLNVGSGKEVSIAELASAISNAVGFGGDLVFDKTKPDGAPRKVLDTTKMLNLGWKPQYDLVSGMEHAYKWYQKNVA